MSLSTTAAGQTLPGLAAIDRHRDDVRRALQISVAGFYATSFMLASASPSTSAATINSRRYRNGLPSLPCSLNPPLCPVECRPIGAHQHHPPLLGEAFEHSASSKPGTHTTRALRQRRRNKVGRLLASSAAPCSGPGPPANCRRQLPQCGMPKADVSVRTSPGDQV